MLTRSIAHRWITLVVTAVLAVVACGVPGTPPSPEPEATAQAPDQRFPDVLDVRLVSRGERVFDVAVTISSPYDTPGRYADGWRVLGPDGTVLGSHELLHDHAGEQPFTRTQTGLTIPEGITEVTIEARDLVHGFGGARLTVPVPEG